MVDFFNGKLTVNKDGLLTGASAIFNGALTLNNAPNSAFLTANEATGNALSYGYITNGNTGLQYGIEGAVPSSLCSGTTQYSAVINANYQRNLELATNNTVRFRLGADGSSYFLGPLTGTSATFNSTGIFGGAISSGSYIVAQSGVVSYDPGGSELNRFGGTTKFGGAVNIGTTQSNANLYVNGTIKSKEVKVEATVIVPDYVFEKSYNLKPLPEVEQYITQNKHLPEIPSAQEIAKEGINVGEMQMQLLKKIEELTLYIIDINKTVVDLKKENYTLKSQVARLEEK